MFSQFWTIKLGLTRKIRKNETKMGDTKIAEIQQK